MSQCIDELDTSETYLMQNSLNRLLFNSSYLSERKKNRNQKQSHCRNNSKLVERPKVLHITQKYMAGRLLYCLGQDNKK